MIEKMKRVLLHLVCAMALLVGLTGCEGFEIIFGSGSGNGGGDNKTEEVGIVLTRCWGLKSFCDTPADMDIIIDFGKDGKFAIYQRTDQLTYTVFNGTYTANEEASVLTGRYNDGTSWASSYHYTVDIEAEELVLESIEKPAEVSVYKPTKLPASVTTKCAAVNSTKPL